MAARRETRSDADAFMARLKGKSLAERQRLCAEHRAYLAGERDVDTDFRMETPAASTGEASTDRPRPPPPPPPLRPILRWKDACYLAAAKKRRERRLAEEAQAKKTTGKQKVTKRQEAVDR
ncbi:unnamed protein product [Phytophthora fragariaefolia]|uniref:Unnamed protein product n=1 Tax=Phytophthora fragariaefolia TaxID=1490495 RepID=A0A9W6YEC8_9STRA|nr:unnamed protein product [Phytophthora fragariaefolia]